MRPNEWLEDEEFIARVDFHDLEYFKSLAKNVANYLKTIPIPVLSTWDPVHKNIYFLIGNEKKFFRVETDISYRDYITLVHRWTRTFFPTYEVETEGEDSLTEEEIIEEMKNDSKADLNELLLRKKYSKRIEKGTITKIRITNDEFHLMVNNNEYVRLSGTMNNPMSLSIFLKHFRELKTDKEKRDFIFKNSEESRIVPNHRKEMIIEYENTMMLNFFVIQYTDLKNIDIIQDNEGFYTWGRYKIKFSSALTKEECFKYLRSRFSQDGLNTKICSN